jgi:hypothetical protein
MNWQIIPANVSKAGKQMGNGAFLVSHANWRKIKDAIFLECEAFSLTSQKDVNGH